MVFPEFWGKGFAREAATVCIDFGLHTLKLNKTIAITQEAHIKSCQLLETIGMEYIRSFELFNAQQCMYKVYDLTQWAGTSLFEEYLKEQEVGARIIWVAHVKGEFVGYMTLKWES